MDIVHKLLLGGLLLAGIPVLLHLIMRQKPKHLLFPAFRFLAQRARTNQRKLQLRHLILLLLRILLIAILCLALARPSVYNERLNLIGGQPVAVALVFDTSASMEYTVTGKSRLEEAKQRANELLNELPDSSRVAVFDSADPVSGEWQPSVSAARERVAGLHIRYANGPVTDVLAPAYRLLGAPDEGINAREQLPRFLYVFSDRTQDSWDDSRRKQLVDLRDRIPPPGVRAAFVDVGVAKPQNLAVAELELPRQIVPANSPVEISAHVRATSRDYDTVLRLLIDDEKTMERKPIKLRAGQGEVVTFTRSDLPPGLHRAEVTLEAPDNLPWSAGRVATFEVRGPRKVLTISDRADDADIWKLALDRGGAFACDVLTTDKANQLPAAELAAYKAICLLDVAEPSGALWDKLKKYVEDGGGLAVVPGGNELVEGSYRDEKGETAVSQLLPAILEKLVDAPGSGTRWKESTYREPLKGWFRDWEKQGNLDFGKLPPRAVRYWAVQPRRDEYVLAAYDDKEGRPALLERTFDRAKVRGRVLMFTTPFDGRTLSPDTDRRWNNYLQTSFYFSLVNKSLIYLAGASDAATFNYRTGQTVAVELPAEPRFTTYLIEGPGLSGASAVVPRAPKQGELRLSQAVLPGQYTLRGGDGHWYTGFSMNVPPGESNLSRVPAEPIEAVLGANSILPLEHNVSLKEQLQNQFGHPIDLFPALMILLLLVLAVENLLANRFYRQQPAQTNPEPEQKGGPA